MKAILRSAAALYVGVSNFASAGNLPTGGSFSVGYDEAWFGQRYSFDLTSGFDQKYVAKMFDGMARGAPRLLGFGPSPLCKASSSVPTARRRRA